MDLNIRKSKDNDVNIIAKNVVAMAKESSGVELDLETVLDGVVSLSKKPDRGFYVVAELDGEIVGSLIIVYEWSDWRNGVHWWIHSVFVEPDHRKKKIYSRMYGYVQEIHKQSKASRDLKLATSADNTGARGAYKNLGMKESDLVTYYS